MARFFASTSSRTSVDPSTPSSTKNSTRHYSNAGTPASRQQAGKPVANSANHGNHATSNHSTINNISSCSSSSSSGSSRWSRRPRLRRQHAHDFDQALEKSILPAPALSLGSGYTEAPSSRGASETLSACSPSVGGLEDFLGDVSDDDLSWLEEDLPPLVSALEPETPSKPSSFVSDSSAFLSEVVEHSLDEEEDEEDRDCPRYCAPLELRIDDFECGECVGKGSYSKVFLGTHVLSGTEWALKVVSKRKTFETRENLAHLREEKNIADKVQGSDFLVRTAGTFQNLRSVVFAMEYLPGGDLYQRLADKSTLPLGEAVAWVAQAVLAIEDLHSRNIVHRDVKPENFLMGKSGTLKLTDFGFARELAEDERLYSQFGTPEYVAPEVLNSCGHGKPVDLWALGVLIYELLVGHTPFKAGSVDEMYERIASGDYAFPAPPARRSPSASKASLLSSSSSSSPHKTLGKKKAAMKKEASSRSKGQLFTPSAGGYRREEQELQEEEEALEEDGAQDPAAQALVKSLLRLSPSRRPTIAEIKQHPFFDGVNFDALRAAVRAQAVADEEEAVVNAAIDGNDVWMREQPAMCVSEEVEDNYGGVFSGF